jgi:hypothetical protein
MKPLRSADVAKAVRISLTLRSGVRFLVPLASDFDYVGFLLVDFREGLSAHGPMD